MNFWIRYPLTQTGFRQQGCGYFIAASRMDHKGPWMVAYAPKNPVGFYSKSMYWRDFTHYGAGIIMEKAPIMERYDWYKRNRPHLSRKRKKRIIGKRTHRA